MDTCTTCSAAVQPCDAHCGQCGADLRTSARQTGVPATAAAFFDSGHVARPLWSPAGFVQRIAAWLVDNAIMNATLIALALVMGWVDLNVWTVLIGFFFSPLSVIYRPALWRCNDGQTVGQRLLCIRVRGAEGGPVGLSRGVWRVLATWLLVLAVTIPVSVLNSLLTLGGAAGLPDAWVFILAPLVALSMLWNAQRRTWFDRWSKTRVEAVAVPATAASS